MWRLKHTTKSFYFKEKLTECPIEKLYGGKPNRVYKYIIFLENNFVRIVQLGV